MSARGYGSTPSEGRPTQAPGMMRHGPAPTLAPVRHPIDTPLPPPELLENNLAIQSAEMDKLFKENHRLAATHGVLRQELLAAQQELQRVQAHAAQVQNETGLQIRNILDKISKMEDDIKAGEIVEKELQQAHMDAQGLVSARMDLLAQIQQATNELERMHSDIKKLPELHSEIERLMEEHQKLRSTFEREKGANMELVQKMHAMEKNLMSMAREVEKLRGEVQDAEKRVQAPTPNPYQSPYGATDPSRNPGHDAYRQSGTYGAGVYGQGAIYSNGGFVQAPSGVYSDQYGRSGQIMVNTSSDKVYQYGANAVEKANPYGSTVATAAYGNTHGSGAYDSAAGMASSYDAARTAAAVASGGAYDAARAAAAATGGGVYDPSRGAIASSNVYDASRLAAAASGNALGMRDASRPSEVAGSYNNMIAAGNAYAMYDASRAAQMPTQR